MQDSDDPFGKAEQAEKTFKEGKVGGQEAEKKFKD